MISYVLEETIVYFYSCTKTEQASKVMRKFDVGVASVAFSKRCSLNIYFSDIIQMRIMGFGAPRLASVCRPASAKYQ